MPEFKIVEGDTRGMEDVQSFIDQINRLDTHPMREAHGLFDEEGEICVGRAPGRLDVMGGSPTTPGHSYCSCRHAMPRSWVCSAPRILRSVLSAGTRMRMPGSLTTNFRSVI